MHAALLTLVLAAAAPAAEARPLTVDDCVAMAIRESGQVMEAEAKVAEWKARLAEVESIFYPKLSATAFAAPMFTVHGNAFTNDVERRWKSPGDWGPYLRLEALLAQPIYTFGRAAAGEKAAQERLAVEQARLAAARNAVALEARKFYYLHLYAKSLRPGLSAARKMLDSALEKANSLYETASGKVTNVDLMKLTYASSELDKYLIQAEVGEGLALAALKHTMGVSEAMPLLLADDVLPDAGDDPPELAELLRIALEKRPELAQVRHGKQAALALERAERLANLPVVALAGQFQASWTPTRDDSKNPYHVDPYNDLFGGVALALQFDLDPALAKAKGDAARAMGEQVAGLEKLATTGIPLEVRKAREEEIQARRMLELSKKGSVATRKWMIFAGTAYASGTGETKDLLEGIAAHLQAKKAYYDNLLAVHTARAELLRATGEVTSAQLLTAAREP
ncbi:MAG: TolC family protein [Myxococcales bacterium]|jgi:outer membrane protein